MTSRPFRLHGRFFLFTWSQVDINEHTHSHFLEILSVLQTLHDLTFASIGHELHADGGHHYHAAVELDSDIDRRLDTQLNIFGRRPNAKNKGRRKQWLDALNYTQKDGDFFIHGTTSITGSVQFDLLEEARAASNFLEFVKQCYKNRVPYPYCQATWNFIQAEHISILEGTICPGDVTSHQLRDCVWAPDTHSLCIIGPSGIGKTTWARNNIPKPALFVTHLDDLKHFSSGFHKAILFDDVSLRHLPLTTQISIADWDNPRSIHCRHTVARIPANTYKCFTCNDEPLDFQHPAIDRRVEILYLD